MENDLKTKEDRIGRKGSSSLFIVNIILLITVAIVASVGFILAIIYQPMLNTIQ